MNQNINSPVPGTFMYGFTVKEVASGLEKYLETTSRLVSRAAARRVEDQRFNEWVQRVDSVISRSGKFD